MSMRNANVCHRNPVTNEEKAAIMQRHNPIGLDSHASRLWQNNWILSSRLEQLLHSHLSVRWTFRQK